MNPIIAALDVPSLAKASSLADRLHGHVGGFKIGLELFSSEGPAIFESFKPEDLFLDLKLHDIPNTVASAVAVLAKRPPQMLTLHATGGSKMLEAANEVKGSILTLAVTMLTSLDEAQAAEVGIAPPAKNVPRLAALAMRSGCDGVVCAPTDVEAVRALCPSPFLIVTPGVRPAGSDRGDQARTATPQQAIKAGADRLVIGRPIYEAQNPAEAAEAILASMGQEE